jgi:hypothetical protein
MLKPLTLTLSLGLALALSGMSRADFFHNGATPSEQAPCVSPQSPAPTAQCVPTCAPKKCSFTMPHLGLHEKMQGLSCGLQNAGHNMSCGFGDLCKKLKPKPPCYTYEWVLKKKKVHGGCGQPGCETCGGPAPIYPTSQVSAAPQGPIVSPAPQFGGTSPQASYGSMVPTTASLGGISPAPMPISGDEAPPAPEVSPRGPTSSLLFSTPSGN